MSLRRKRPTSFDNYPSGVVSSLDNTEKIQAVRWIIDISTPYTQTKVAMWQLLGLLFWCGLCRRLKRPFWPCKTMRHDTYTTTNNFLKIIPKPNSISLERPFLQFDTKSRFMYRFFNSAFSKPIHDQSSFTTWGFLLFHCCKRRPPFHHLTKNFYSLPLQSWQVFQVCEFNRNSISIISTIQKLPQIFCPIYVEL